MAKQKILYFIAGGGNDCESSISWEVGTFEFWEGYHSSPTAEDVPVGGAASPATFRDLVDIIRESERAVELTGDPLELTLSFKTRDDRIIEIKLIGKLDEPLFCRIHVFGEKEVMGSG